MRGDCAHACGVAGFPGTNGRRRRCSLRFGNCCLWTGPVSSLQQLVLIGFHLDLENPWDTWRTSMLWPH